MTVSNVINNRTEKVSQNTLEKVNSVIKRLGYTPNMYARSLVLNSSRVVAYINTMHRGISDPVNSTFIDALEHALSGENYYLMIKTIMNPAELKSFLQNWNLVGMFFLGIYSQEMVDVVQESNIPSVFVDSYFTCDNAANIGLDDFQSAYNGTEFLIKKGHKNIAVAAQSSVSIGVNKARLTGFKKAMQEYNLPVRQELIFDTCGTSDNTIAVGEHLAKTKATAIFAFSDFTAIELMRGIVKAGKRIPDDISILGFDDINLCRLTTPQLTTIHQDVNKKGDIAVEKFIKLLEGKAKLRNITLSTHIVERASVKSIQ